MPYVFVIPLHFAVIVTMFVVSISFPSLLWFATSYAILFIFYVRLILLLGQAHDQILFGIKNYPNRKDSPQ